MYRLYVYPTKSLGSQRQVAEGDKTFLSLLVNPAAPPGVLYEVTKRDPQSGMYRAEMSGPGCEMAEWLSR